MSKPLFPYCPIQDGYGVAFSDGILTTDLAGGPAFRRLDVVGGPSRVQVSFVLKSPDAYSLFQGHIRNWIRSGGDFFEIDIIVDSGEMERYEASFVPGSIQLVSKQGPVFTVSATLEVLPRYETLDEATDEAGAAAMVHAFYGPDTSGFLNLLDQLVNEDLPSKP